MKRFGSIVCVTDRWTDRQAYLVMDRSVQYDGYVCLQAAVLGFPEPGYIEISSPNLTQDASIGFSFQTEQSDALLLLAKGSVAVRCCCRIHWH